MSMAINRNIRELLEKSPSEFCSFFTRKGTMPKNNTLLHAKDAKADNFFTSLIDIENEAKHYRQHFTGKVVLCNCDDPRVSNFFRYFALNFEYLGLKKLICSCYKNQDVDFFFQRDVEKAVYIEYTGNKNGNKVPDPEELDIKFYKGDGDFRSEECIELLKQADIVCTNPPFSLFREYVAQLIKYGKKFLIIGNINDVTYKEVFPLIQSGQMWLGCSIHSGDREFGVPKDYPLKASGCRVDENGNQFICVKGVRWFTNLDYHERHEDLILYKIFKGHEEEFPKYDNYDAIEVGRTSDIPLDYDGLMGVPITFLDKYNPDQFEIVGMAKRGAGDPALKSRVYTKDDYPNYNALNAAPTLWVNGVLHITYPRILIRHTHPVKM